MTLVNSESRKDMGWENRVLCSDGNCIGVIGPDGRCKECARVYEGELPESLKQNGGSHESGENRIRESAAWPEKTDQDSIEKDEEALQENVNSDDQWHQRRLCSDGNCIGVIGPDGRCKECGLSS
ncbi:MAG: hypothetical protein GY874_22365 [Desulfobacteraceae bacterium]|nr:hypothetical protein [Desulfobacteraceae bacterium]